jgi:hypothetical protein
MPMARDNPLPRISPLLSGALVLDGKSKTPASIVGIGLAEDKAGHGPVVGKSDVRFVCPLLPEFNATRLIHRFTARSTNVPRDFQRLRAFSNPVMSRRTAGNTAATPTAYKP